jgi:hypothetical protein
MANYKVASEEGAQRYGVEVGKTVDIDLDESTERALVCAGWLEPTTKPKEAK